MTNTKESQETFVYLVKFNDPDFTAVFSKREDADKYFWKYYEDGAEILMLPLDKRIIK